ncbi:unnamed protein product [Brassica oleracea var. botrytis]|uniref:Cathepsin propeptide inhibitor domain-containing protein n=1 Tax=Brassica oleracea TaxID=3712 RepID=A0A3P6EAC2_BRAOL|nr:unnamed protein product [Brassica oleracea]
MVVSYVILVLTILSMDLRISQAPSRVIFQETTIADYHQHWMIQFSRVYSDESEKQMRLKIFKKNSEFIENFNNKRNQSYKLGVNEFTDLTDEEFLATNTGLSDINVISPSVTMLPWNWNVSQVGESKGWRKEGVVTPVKKQGGCVINIWGWCLLGVLDDYSGGRSNKDFRRKPSITVRTATYRL